MYVEPESKQTAFIKCRQSTMHIKMKAEIEHVILFMVK